MNTLFSDILFDSGYLLIMTGSLIALIFGLGLLLIPDTVLKLNTKINQSFTPKIKNARIKSEPFFYRHAKVNGAILILGSLFVLYTLFTFNFYSLIPYLPKQFSPAVWSWLLHAGKVFFFIGSAFILVFGLIVFIRPSLIKSFETAANRWFSVQPFFSFLNTHIDIDNKWLSTYPRIFGFFFILFALFILFFLPASL